MSTQSRIDDATAEALLAGRAVSAEFEPLAEVMMAYRRMADQPVRPSAELAHQMSVGLFTRPVECTPQPTVNGSHWRRRRRTPVRTALVSLVAGAGALVTGVASAGFAGVLPGPAQDRFESVVESVTPLDLPRGTDPDNTEPGEFGEEVGEDAVDGGVNGDEIGERARQQGDQHRPTELPTAAPGPPSEVPAPVDPEVPDDPGPPEDPGPPDGNPPAPPNGADSRPTAPSGG